MMPRGFLSDTHVLLWWRDEASNSSSSRGIR